MAVYCRIKCNQEVEKMGVEELNKENFKDLEKSEVPVIIDFWAAWCGPCQLMGPVFEDLSGDYKGKLNFMKVDIMSEQAIAAAYGISSIPTLVIVNKGKEAGRISGYMGREALKQKIDSLLSGLGE